MCGRRSLGALSIDFIPAAEWMVILNAMCSHHQVLLRQQSCNLFRCRALHIVHRVLEHDFRVCVREYEVVRSLLSLVQTRFCSGLCIKRYTQYKQISSNLAWTRCKYKRCRHAPGPLSSFINTTSSFSSCSKMRSDTGVAANEQQPARQRTTYKTHEHCRLDL